MTAYGHNKTSMGYSMWYFYIIIEKSYRQLNFSIDILTLRYSNSIDSYAIKIKWIRAKHINMDKSQKQNVKGWKQVTEECTL